MNLRLWGILEMFLFFVIGDSSLLSDSLDSLSLWILEISVPLLNSLFALPFSEVVKRATSLRISKDSQQVFVSDKFGDIVG